MLVKEYRVLLPLDISEYQNGQLYSVAEASKAETGGGEGVEFLKQEFFESGEIRPGHIISGTYTHKLYHLKSKMPWILRKLLPDSAMVFEEECWNAYPYCKTVLTNPGYMKENFFVTIETLHIQDNGSTENALGLSKDVLKHREIVMLDIYDDMHLNPKTDIKSDTDPRTFKSLKTDRGPLTADWATTTTPVMCAYKVVTAYFKWTGFQTRMERMIHGSYPRLFTKFHREVFCWIDRWIDLTIEEIRKFEDETATNLKQQIKNGNICGMTASTDEN